MNTNIPEWIVPGARVYAWLPPPSREKYVRVQWETSIVSVYRGGRSRRDVPSVTLKVPEGKCQNKSYFEHYPVETIGAQTPTTLTIRIFKDDRLQVEQLELVQSDVL